MRKSLKIAPGVRLNVSARGVGVSAGVRGARYSVHSSGRRTTSLSIPGTGMGWRSSSGGSRRSSTRSTAASRSAALAISLVEDLPPSTVAAVSLAELYVQTQQYEEVLELTNGLKNEDEASALLLVFRGSALHALGHHDAAVEALKEALRARSRPAPIRHLALVQRAEAYQALGQRAAARKDLERVLADDASFPGLTERLEALGSGAAVNAEIAEAAPPPAPRPAQRDSALAERDWRREVEGALGRLATHLKGATALQKGALREALKAGEIPIAVLFGSVKIDGKSLGLMPVPVCLTEGDVVVVAKDGVQRISVGTLSSVNAGGSRLGGGTLALRGTRALEVTGIRPHDAAEVFAGHLSLPQAAGSPPANEVASKPVAAPEWYPDPTRRHHYRYWDGSTWTEDVATEGVVSTDPLSPEDA